MQDPVLLSIVLRFISMIKVCRKGLSVILVFFVSASTFGCKARDNITLSDFGAFSSSSFEIPKKEGYDCELQHVLKDGDNTCISVVYSQYDIDNSLINQHTDIFTVDNQGNRLYTLELAGNQVPNAVLEKEYVYLGYRINEVEQRKDADYELHRTAVFLDKKTGEPIRTIDTDFQPYYVSEIKDGFVIVGQSNIARYSKDGLLIANLELDFSCYIDDVGFFEDGDSYFVIEEKEFGEFVYHEVNFETGDSPSIAKGTDIGIVNRHVCGQYFFNSEAEYKVDLCNMSVVCVADYNNIDIRPPQKALNTPRQEFCLDDDRFAIYYEYKDKTKEVLLFCYDPTIDRSKITNITIGGYGVFDDPVLQWAVYSFNTSNTEYRVVLEDYSRRFDAYLPEERRKATLALTQYFNEGNTPDIFYGTRFDYSYMGRNGMVIDMSSYMNVDNYSLPIMTEAATRLMIDGNGACYQVFSGYVMYGYSVQESVLKEVKDTSVFSLYQYAQDNEVLYSASSPSDIVDTAIRYNFADLWGGYDGNRIITREELAQLVSIVLSLPISQTPYVSEEDVKNGKALMSNTTVFCEIPDDKSATYFQYIGYPSIHGSVHLAIPQSCLAISTTAKNKEKCWEMISMLLSDDAQKQTVLSGYIPVTQNAVDTFCEITMHPDSVTDGVWKSYIGQGKAVDQEAVNRFLKTISMADTVATYDWGVFDIIYDEVNSYYSQKRSPEQITETLEKRLTLYIKENYQ